MHVEMWESRCRKTFTKSTFDWWIVKNRRSPEFNPICALTNFKSLIRLLRTALLVGRTDGAYTFILVIISFFLLNLEANSYFVTCLKRLTKGLCFGLYLHTCHLIGVCESPIENTTKPSIYEIFKQKNVFQNI